MKVQRSAAVQLLVDLGFKATIANDLSDVALAGKMLKLRNVVGRKEPATAESAALLKEIVAAAEAKEEVEIVNDEAAAPAAKADKKAAKKTPATKATAKGAKGAKGPKADKKTAKATKGATAAPRESKGPRVGTMISSIISQLCHASKSKPVTKAAIAEKLTKEFKDRDADSISTGVQALVNTPQMAKRGVTLFKDGETPRGYWGELKAK